MCKHPYETNDDKVLRRALRRPEAARTNERRPGDDAVMKNQSTCSVARIELSRRDRVMLHLRCLLRDHKYRWHLAGICSELTGH